MKYETRMKFDKHAISEEYVVDNKTYRAELNIRSLGFCTGMAGYDACSVEVLLYEKGSEYSIGSVGIGFPLLKCSDITKSEQMLEPCLEKGFNRSMPPVRKFTPFAEREIERVVTEFIRKEEDFSMLGFPLHSISVSVGTQDSSGRGRAFPRGPVNQQCMKE